MNRRIGRRTDPALTFGGCIFNPATSTMHSIIIYLYASPGVRLGYNRTGDEVNNDTHTWNGVNTALMEAAELNLIEV